MINRYQVEEWIEQWRDDTLRVDDDLYSPDLLDPVTVRDLADRIMTRIRENA